ncbi:MAG: hypothetical protein Q7T11_00495 [Deltaproteobacteria bacterium]|nr:hypothetical protein [Deltaproteobacteria bacterium]
MKATTLKIEDPLLQRLHHFKPASQSLSSFARELLESGIRRKQMTEAADKYSRFLEDNEDEREWLSEWGDADLITAPKKSKGKFH